MGLAGFFGYLFLAGGPLASLFLFCIATKSFLVLLSLASAFYWLVTLFIISALFRGFAPLDPSIGPYVGLVLVAVLIQEVARYLLWRFHRLSIRALEFVAGLEEHRGASLTVSDHFSLSFTHGLAHSITHTLFFSISWLPFSIGDGTIYSKNCPQMSYYLVSALTTLAFAGVLTGGMIIAFEAAERRDFKTSSIPSLVHLVAALFTLINFTQDGCLVSVPLLLVTGLGMGVWAGKVWWKKTGLALGPLGRRPSLGGGEAAIGAAAPGTLIGSNSGNNGVLYRQNSSGISPRVRQTATHPPQD